jgi:hypothetical protein
MDTDKKHIFDNKKNVQRVLYGLFSSLILLLAIEPFCHLRLCRLCAPGACGKIRSQAIDKKGRGLL